MRIQAELFMAENFLMNLLLLHTAAALSGLPLRRWVAVDMAAAGSLYALLGVWRFPVLLSGALRVVFLPLLTCALRTTTLRDFLRGMLFVGGANILLSGTVLLLCSVLGGMLWEGAILLHILPWQLLTAQIVCLGLPRLLRTLRSRKRKRETQIGIRVTCGERVWQGNALVDTGNLLTEPVTGLPVIVLPPVFHREGGLPVPFCGIEGAGMLYAFRPGSVELFLGRWRQTDALVAQLPDGAGQTRAIVGLTALPEGE